MEHGTTGERARNRGAVNPRIVWLIALLIVSELVGIAVAQWFWQIYLQTVPPAMLTGFNKSTAHGWFLTNGALLGLVFPVWGVASAFVGRFLSGLSRRAEA